MDRRSLTPAVQPNPAEQRLRLWAGVQDHHCRHARKLQYVGVIVTDSVCVGVWVGCVWGGGVEEEAGFACATAGARASPGIA